MFYSSLQDLLFVSCKKEQQSKLQLIKAPNNATLPGASLTSLKSSEHGYYTELQPDPANPGNYTAYLNGVELDFNGLSVESGLYYPLSDGVPVYGNASIHPGQNQSVVLTKDIMGAGTSVVLQTNVITLQDGETIHKDLAAYEKDFETFISDNSKPLPYIGDYLKGTHYSVQTVTARLIYISSGSGWAIATQDYVIPHPYYASNEVYLGELIDPQTSIHYFFYGQGDHLTRFTTPQISGASSITGTFKVLDDSLDSHVTGTLTRSDGSTYNFDSDFSSN